MDVRFSRALGDFDDQARTVGFARPAARGALNDGLNGRLAQFAASNGAETLAPVIVPVTLSGAQLVG